MRGASTKVTYEDYLALPETIERIELIDGQLVREPSPGAPHQRIVGNLYDGLRRLVRKQALGTVFLGPLDVVLGPEGEEEVFQPDLLFVARERMAIVARVVGGAPDLAVEVLSPSTRRRDREVKRQKYARCGVREFWLVDPAARTVEILTREAGRFVTHGVFSEGASLSSPVLGGVTMAVGEIFEA